VRSPSKGQCVAPVAGVSARAGVVIGLALFAACARGEPPTPPGSPSIAPPDDWPVASAPPKAPAAVQSVAAWSSATRDAAEAGAHDAEPQGPGGGALTQTHALPAASGAAFDARVKALWDAIVHDDPEQGLPFFFPLSAYRQVKDVADPEADWRRRLFAAYARDIHELHRRLSDADGASTLTSLTVPMARARWVEPGEEWNKLGYYRVYGSRLHYAVGDEDHAFNVRSLISWRGEWYVVHLGEISAKHTQDGDGSRP